MRYLALGDSMSIDKYTGVEGGGAVSQFARLLGAGTVEDLTHDGLTTDAVIEALERAGIEPEIVTLTAGGNDLLQRPTWNMDRFSLQDPDSFRTLGNLDLLARRLAEFCCPVIMNTIYDPTDGDDRLLAQLGMTPEFRVVYETVNDGIRALAERQGFLLSDLQGLFAGHGMRSDDSWITLEIEPNHAGATAIARHWHELFQRP